MMGCGCLTEGHVTYVSGVAGEGLFWKEGGCVGNTDKYSCVMCSKNRIKCPFLDAIEGPGISYFSKRRSNIFYNLPTDRAMATS